MLNRTINNPTTEDIFIELAETCYNKVERGYSLCYILIGRKMMERLFWKYISPVLVISSIIVVLVTFGFIIYKELIWK